MSYDPTDCELGICGPCETCVEQMQIDDMPPEPEPTTKLTPDDFKSLLETEPLEKDDGTYVIRAHPEKEGAYALIRQERDLAQKTATAAVERIKMLEGVLVAMRSGLGAFRSCSHRKDAERLTSLINETLDPHKPWCADERHEGACIGKDDGYEGERDE